MDALPSRDAATRVAQPHPAEHTNPMVPRSRRGRLSRLLTVGVLLAGAWIGWSNPGPRASEGDEAATEDGSVTEAEGPKKHPIPEADALAAMVERLRGIYKKEYRARGKEEQLALAKRLLDQAAETTEDPVARYAMLSEGARLCLEGGDFDRAMQTLEAIGGEYDGDLTPRKLMILEATAKSMKRPDEADAAILAEAYMGLMFEALRAGNTEVAYDAAGEAGTLARKAKDKDLYERAKDWKKEAYAVKRALRSVEKSQKALTTNPDDPAANLEVGRYLAFLKDRWQEGLPHLAKSGDQRLKALATVELGDPTLPAAHLQLAKGWWEQATKEEDLLPAALLKIHAGHWYKKALPEMSGLDKAEAEKRLEEVEALLALFGGEDLPGPVAVGGTAPGLFLRYFQDEARKTLSGEAAVMEVWQPTEGVNAKVWMPRGENRGKGAYLIEGFLMVPVSGEYIFHIRGDGEVQLTVGESTHVEKYDTKERLMVKLRKGKTPFRVQYEHGTNATMNWLWQPPKSEGPEPIPPAALVHDPVVARKAGYKPPKDEKK